MKILCSKRYRSNIAQLLRKNGDFIKDKGKYIQGELEIWFLDICNISDKHIEWSDLICYESWFCNNKIMESKKLFRGNIIEELKYYIYGYEELFQVQIRNENNFALIDIEIKPIKVLKYQVERYLTSLHCFRTEKEAVEYSYSIIKSTKIRIEEAKKRIEKMKKDWEKSLNSF
jgi:hypothetical protein